ncbi:MAG: flap endonuclease [Ruminococcaceae bacterium]|nr:flap endonuclease [Oscillospiraceae bacterium]
MNKKLLLVDGHNLLFRMFFGMPDTFYTQSGKKYNAVYGFIHALTKVISMVRPSHVFVAFDSEDCGDRRDLDTAYKANRPDYSEMSPNDCPFSQLRAIYSVLDDIGVPNSEICGCEADDVIASYALRYSDEMNVVIMSTDRDYWQLISPTVSILDYHGSNSTLITPSDVEKKFGVSPSQFADFKCLIGDKSDNIVGVHGIGPKRAAELLVTYGSIDGIYENIDAIDRASTKKALLESKERLELNARLIKLNNISNLPVEIDELKYVYVNPGNVFDRSARAAEMYIDV